MIWTIAKREYLAVVRKRTFWLSTLAFPVLIGFIAFITGFSSSQADELFNFSETKDDQQVQVIDNTGLIDETKLPEGFILIDDKSEGIASVKNEDSIALIAYPENLNEDEFKIEIYAQYEGLLLNERFNTVAETILRQSILENLPAEQLSIIQSDINFDVTTYEQGEQKEIPAESLVVPGIAVVIYFILVTFGASFMLASVSEEKESRMIEIILSSVTPKDLIRGKLIGLLGVVLTQTALLLTLGILSLMVFDLSLPIDFSEIPVQPATIIISAITILLAFIVLANAMIGVGSAVPTLKEAQGLSTIFVMASVIPIYFVTLILASPDSTFSVILSHLPLTGPITFLFRNVVYSVPPVEILTIYLSLVIQVVVSNYAAFKLFELGALQFQNPIKLSWLFRR